MEAVSRPSSIVEVVFSPWGPQCTPSVHTHPGGTVSASGTAVAREIACDKAFKVRWKSSVDPHPLSRSASVVGTPYTTPTVCTPLRAGH